MLRLLCAAALVAVVGCDAPQSVSQRLVGEWSGRPETAAERTLREWPGSDPAVGADPDDPQVAAAVADTPPTDLEAVGPVAIGMTLDAAGTAELSLAGEETLTAEWKVEPRDGRRAELLLTIPGQGDQPTLRCFDLEFTRDGDRFTLRESGADRQFGRLLFTRSDAAAQSPTAQPTTALPTTAEATP